MLRQPSALLVDEVRRGKASNWTAWVDPGRRHRDAARTAPRDLPAVLLRRLRRRGSAPGTPVPAPQLQQLDDEADLVGAVMAATATLTVGRDSRPARLSQRTTRSERRCRTSVLVALSPSRRSVSTCALPNIHLCWLYGWFGRLRSDRPVMAGQRARMPAHRATRALPARTRAVPRGGRAARLHRQPIPRALTTPPAGTGKRSIAVQETGRCGCADGSVVTGARLDVRDLAQIPGGHLGAGLPKVLSTVVSRRYEGTHRTPR
jgi:hypothetical protein